MDRVRARLQTELPQLSAYFQTGGLVDAILNLGMPAPWTSRSAASDLEAAHDTATRDRPAGRARCRASATCWCRRTWITRRCKLDIDRDARQRTGPERKGSGRQRHHRADLERDDRAQLLGGSQDRQRLLAHRPVSGELREEPGRPWRPCRCAAPRSPEPTRLDAVSHDHATSRRRPKWITTSSGASSTLRVARRARIWAGC